MEDKQDGISSCKTMTSHYNIFQGKQILEYVNYQEKIKSILKKIRIIFKW